jgi:hypothetical protein
VSLRRYDGLAIDCDEPDCLEVFSDSVSISLANLRKAARRAGWSITSDDYGCDLCPTHLDRAREQLHVGLPCQDEGDR